MMKTTFLKDKAIITDKVSMVCATDLHPFSFTEGKGFISVVQAIIKVKLIKDQSVPSIYSLQKIPRKDIP